MFMHMRCCSICISYFKYPDRFVLVWKMAFNLAKHLISIHRLSKINLSENEMYQNFGKVNVFQCFSAGICILSSR